jgi:hypothetical protein
MIYNYFIALFCSPYWHTVPSSAISLPCGDIGWISIQIAFLLLEDVDLRRGASRRDFDSQIEINNKKALHHLQHTAGGEGRGIFSRPRG